MIYRTYTYGYSFISGAVIIGKRERKKSGNVKNGNDVVTIV